VLVFTPYRTLDESQDSGSIYVTLIDFLFLLLCLCAIIESESEETWQELIFETVFVSLRTFPTCFSQLEKTLSLILLTAC